MKPTKEQLELIPNHIVIALDDELTNHVRLSKETALRLYGFLHELFNEIDTKDCCEPDHSSVHYCPYREARVIMTDNSCQLIDVVVGSDKTG